MSKVKKSSRPLRDKKETSAEKFSLEKIIPQKYQVPLIILVIILLYLIFLNPLYFGGKTFESGDITASQSAKAYIDKDRDGFSLWNPYIFCGMPAYAIGTEFTWFNMIYVGVTGVRNVFTSLFANDYVKWTFYLMLLGITSFFFMRYLTKNLMVSLFSAIAMSFSTGLIVFLFIGHVTKLTSLCMYPLIFLMLLRMQERIRLIDFLLLIVALQIFVQGFHVQIIFYTLFAVGIYFIYYLVRAIAKKEAALRNNLLKSAGVFAVAAIIAILIQSDSLTQIYEYTPYSTRGTEGILEKSKSGVSETGSDYYSYHTDWSFSPGEVLTFVVPSWYGFGDSKYKGDLSQGQEVAVNTYFGQMPFVNVAMYMGVLVFFLGLFAVFTRWKEPFVQFLTILTAIALILSFGKNFPVLFDLFFYHLPNFNKFRVPSMILVLVQVTFPVLAGLGLMKIISLRNEPDQKLIKMIKNIAFVFTGIFILSLVLNGSVVEWFTGRINEYAAGLQSTNQRMAQQYQALAPYSSSMFSTDLILAFLFLTITFWASHLYINRKISGDLLVIVVILITIVDLWRIDARGANYQEAPEKNNYFVEPDYIKVIKAQNDKEPFRILNLKQDGSMGSIGSSNGNFNAAFLVEDFYGYSGIKPRAYQDIIDVVGPANPVLWRMSNVKYLVFQQPIDIPGLTMIQNSQSGIVYQDANVLPRVYLVNRVEKKGALEFLNMVKALSFNPKDIAFVEDKEVSVDKPDSTAGVKIASYAENKLVAEVSASGKNFLVFSSTYLPTGWKAFVDGNKTELYRTNHDFMGIVVPQGKHSVEFRYAPNSFYIAKYTSLILSSLVVAGLIFVVFVNRKKVKG